MHHRRQRMWTLLVVGVALLAACWAAWADEPATDVPRQVSMRLIIGGIAGPSYAVIYDSRGLRYYAADSMFNFSSARPVVIRTTDAQWATFLKSLDAAKVWTWGPNYTDPDVDDGTTWQVTITYEDEGRTIVSSGSNAYPVGFIAFRKAVSLLIGNRRFQ